ncbi:hypothetical protein FA13DRAFT_1735678 [Coprinellus micaceus]|uniref:Uncharacterized protein n=1 Tax=Coprinellus micaceus TaxID=71717 RepID=A0A4Y7T2B8_COPMI|nr:hypothetical protein FA13DRAFT_1735678 [Coprinellus micaceus]
MVALTKFILSICVTAPFLGVRAIPYPEVINQQRSGLQSASPYARGIVNDGVDGTLDARNSEAGTFDGRSTIPNSNTWPKNTAPFRRS